MAHALPRPIHFKSESFRELDLGYFRIVEARFLGPQEMNPHYHERPTLGVFLEGQMDKRFTRYETNVTAATTFVMPAGEKHIDDFPAPYSRTLVIEPDITAPGASDLLYPFRHLLEEIYAQRDEELFGFARQVAAELGDQDDFTAASVSGLGFEMLAKAARLKRTPVVTNRSAPGWLRHAQEYLHAHFTEKIQVADVAQVVDIHPVHLSRMFREHTGLPVGAYIRKARLEWAADRLARTRDAITSIAIEAGFSDQSHFTRAFRREYGVTPGRYRKELGG